VANDIVDMKRVENDVVILTSDEVVVMHFPDASPVRKMDHYLAKLAWEPADWDFLVTCAGEEFKGIRHILNRVPFFEAALTGRFEEGKAQRVEIHDARIKAFRAVWHYIYTDEWHPDDTYDLDIDELIDALSLAKRFELAALLQLVGEELAEVGLDLLGKGDLLKVLRAATLYKLRNLRMLCCDRISEIGIGFLQDDEVCAMLPDIISSERDTYMVITSAIGKRRRTT